ncbi:MAG: hypothetical protein WA133_04360 [Syntrophales bacterium]
MLRDTIEKMAVRGPKGVNIEALPFSINDTTAGNETELQALVIGNKRCVDLPVIIAQSNYFANILRRSAAGDLTNKAVNELEQFINGNAEEVWENSWVRFPRKYLGAFANQILECDLLTDKSDPGCGKRTDVDRFLYRDNGHDFLRIPISYLLKLALADAIDYRHAPPTVIEEQGRILLDHFLCDNTSPETYSFHVVSLRQEQGQENALVRETAQRFLFTQLLMMYANTWFGLADGGQRAMVFFSPHPPLRQKKLNACISDAFYRELFMNPCLTGWNRGESKQEYMHMCHRVLSRSQLNAVAKLREAGIITSNLVVLPNTSNISLANNGIHVSLGSRKLGALMEDQASGFSAPEEKYVGDLAIKILEHFLPLFVGTYSAAPYRLDFTDFHPEKALGFLPHELDFTHLRMIWRRWKNKAHLKILGRSVTPFGPLWLDRLLSGLFDLRGDCVPDYRLIDYLVAMMSTEKSPALDGTLNNHARLKQDLSDLGVFDKQMSLYSFIKLREYGVMGFSGFESRHYSLFPSFAQDMGQAVDLQNLLHALAYKYIAQGTVTHAHIPDDPFIESERRQIIFGCAVNIPTFYVRRATGNQFLRKIVSKCERMRASRRYPGYLRLYHKEYCRALIRILQEDAADLIDLLRLKETISDLTRRIDEPSIYGAAGKLQRGILNKGIFSPLDMKGEEFNGQAEKYYRNDLRKAHIREAWQCLAQDLQRLETGCLHKGELYRDALQSMMRGQCVADFIALHEQDILEEKASADVIVKLLHLMILTIHADRAMMNLHPVNCSPKVLPVGKQIII